MGLTHRLRVLLDIEPKKYPKLIGRGHAIYNGLTGNQTLFVPAYAGLPTLETRIDALDQAQQLVSTRAKGAVAARNLRARELITSLEGAQNYVQELVDANPEQGMLLIEKATMKAAEVATYNKPFLRAVQMVPSTTVLVIANVGLLKVGLKGRIFFNWQYTANGGQSWVNMPSTPHGQTEIAALAPMQTYGFRVNVTHRKGTTAWSDAVTLLVV